MGLFGRDDVAAAIRALQDELAGGPPARVSQELQLLAHLVATRDHRAERRREPERELLAGLPDAAGIVAADGRLRLANPKLDALAPAGRAVGHAPIDIVRSSDLADATRRALRGAPQHLEAEMPALRRRYAASVTPMDRGEALLLLRDVTQQVRAEASRRDFVANASHELRTPVAAIRGAAETLLGGALGSPLDARRFVEVIARHAERLARLTQDLLDLSRLETGQWPMSSARVELAPLASNVLELYAAAAREKDVRLQRDVAAGVAARADVRALEQVLVNLVDNAVKYSPAGAAVTVGAVVEGGQVVIAVTDTGPGIERHHLPRLFERFYRVDAGRSREAGGTGLGLALVKHLVLAQRGDVGVESGPGGTRFWVRLPAA